MTTIISDKISDTIVDIITNINNIEETLTKIKSSTDISDNINNIKEKIVRLQQDEKTINNVTPLRKSDGTAKILKNNFKHLYNKQYTKNATLIVGIILVSGIIIKMSFYETIDYPRVL
jgi:hypothetical protein